MSRFFSASIACVVALSLTGCLGSKITGKVVFDGAPLESGTILFFTADSKATTVSAPIKNGEFNLDLPHGAYKVNISAEKMMPAASGVKGAPEEMRNYIPKRYQGNYTELNVTVDGSPMFFDLKSGDGPKKK